MNLGLLRLSYCGKRLVELADEYMFLVFAMESTTISMNYSNALFVSCFAKAYILVPVISTFVAV